MSTIAIGSTPNAVSPSAAHLSATDGTAEIATVGDDISAAGAAVDAVVADEAAVTSAIAAAAANGTISGDGTAAGLVADIGTAFTTLTDDLDLVPDLVAQITTDLALVPNNAGYSSPVVLVYDPAVVITKNAMRSCLMAMMRSIDGADDLT